MNAELKHRLWRWTRGLCALGIGVTGVAYLAPRIASVNLETAQVGHDAHQIQGHYVVENRSDFPWTLAPARAQGGDETVQLVSSETPYQPDGSRSLDVYHCFVLNPNFARDVMVTGAEVIPGNRQIVHHAILYKVEPSQAAVVLAKDRETGGKGWDCFGGPGLTDDPRTATAGGNWLSVWVPGASDGRFPRRHRQPHEQGIVDRHGSPLQPQQRHWRGQIKGQHQRRPRREEAHADLLATAHRTRGNSLPGQHQHPRMHEGVHPARKRGSSR
ncbi:MAG: hypothetical protein HC933_20975 [Pleurocapsa sp. SU_196_0]|nr:hypothetical protein [Pleurocapsa sp. SU_196_0]